MNGFYIYNDGAFLTANGSFTVSDKECIEISVMGLAADESFTIYEEFGLPCDNLTVPATNCCTAMQLTADCPKLLICEPGKYWVGVLGVPPDEVEAQDPATFPADIKVFAQTMDSPASKGGGCGCS